MTIEPSNWRKAMGVGFVRGRQNHLKSPIQDCKKISRLWDTGGVEYTLEEGSHDKILKNKNAGKKNAWNGLPYKT